MKMSAQWPLICSAVAFALPAQAATTLVHVAGDFAAPQPFNVTEYRSVDGLPGNEFVRFGAGVSDTNFQQGRLHFATVRNRSVTFDAPLAFGNFNLLNMPLAAGTGLTSIRLSLAPTLDVEGSQFQLTPLLLDLAFDETPNSGQAVNCPFPSVSPCSDRVRLAGGTLTGNQAVSGGTLSYRILGFSDGAGGISDNFIADEFAATGRDVIGSFAFVAAGVPEPSAWALLIIGFGAVGAGLRGRRPRRVALAFR